MQDSRASEALKACMNCGICTAICPAAEFFDYDPRQICDTVQRKDENAIYPLHRSVAQPDSLQRQAALDPSTFWKRRR